MGTDLEHDQTDIKLSPSHWCSDNTKNKVHDLIIPIVGVTKYNQIINVVPLYLSGRKAHYRVNCRTKNYHEYCGPCGQLVFSSFVTTVLGVDGPILDSYNLKQYT